MSRLFLLGGTKGGPKERGRLRVFPYSTETYKTEKRRRRRRERERSEVLPHSNRMLVVKNCMCKYV